MPPTWRMRFVEAAGRFLVHRSTRYVLAWLLALGAAAASVYYSWNDFRTDKRADGNSGHTTIDFGGQWLMGRLLVEGRGRHLYHRQAQRAVLTAAYPKEDQEPDAKTSDAESLMTSLMGRDDPKAAATVASCLTPLAAPAAPAVAALVLAGHEQAWQAERLEQAAAPRVGGSLYPPLNAFLYYPLGLLRPLYAYHAVQVVGVGLAFLAGWGLRQLAPGRIWWPVASAVVLVYPGYSGSLNLGQNAALTLTILIWGWVLMARGRPGWGGVVWGFLAFKPVWALAFFLVPVLTGRWRVCLTMLATAAALAAATLPFVGVQTWLDWLQVGRGAAVLYTTDQNWIFLSRDLLSIPRRWLLNFDDKAKVQDSLAATLAGWALLLAVLELTVRLAVLRREQARAFTGPPAAFLLLGAWLCCYHFMYYDVLLTALPVLLLFTEPREYLRPHYLAVLPVSVDQLGPDLARYYQPGLARDPPPEVPLLEAGHRHLWVVNRMVPSLLVVLLLIEHLNPHLGVHVSVAADFLEQGPVPQPLKLTTNRYGPPWDTFCLAFLWLWCGWLWLRSGGPGSGVRGRAHASASEFGAAREAVVA